MIGIQMLRMNIIVRRSYWFHLSFPSVTLFKTHHTNWNLVFSLKGRVNIECFEASYEKCFENEIAITLYLVKVGKLKVNKPKF